MVGSNGDTVLTGETTLEFEGAEGRSVEIVGDSVNVFELIGHILLVCTEPCPFNFIVAPL